MVNLVRGIADEEGESKKQSDLLLPYLPDLVEAIKFLFQLGID